MRKFFLILVFCLIFSVPVLAMGHHGGFPDGHHGGGHHGGGGHDCDGNNGGGGTPEPITMLMIVGGGLAALGIKKVLPKK